MILMFWAQSQEARCLRCHPRFFLKIWEVELIYCFYLFLLLCYMGTLVYRKQILLKKMEVPRGPSDFAGTPTNGNIKARIRTDG